MKRLRTYRGQFRSNACLPALIMFLGLAVLAAGCMSSRDDKLREAAALAGDARNLFTAEDFSQALAHVNQAIALNTEFLNDTALAENDLLAARCHRQLGNYDSSLTYCKSAIGRFHSLSDRNRERKAIIALSEFDLSMNRLTDALANASDAATSAKLFADMDDAYSALLVVAKASHQLQKYDRERAALEELIVMDSLGRRGKERDRLYASLFRAATAQNKGLRANGILDRWMEISNRTGDNLGIGMARYELGRAYAAINRPDSALRMLSSALEKINGADDRVIQTDVWMALGTVAFTQHQYENARSYFANALDRAGRLCGVAQSQLLQLAMLACDLNLNNAGPSSDVVARVSALADTCGQKGLVRLQAFALLLKGRVQEKLNGPDAALQSFREAVHCIDRTMPAAENDAEDFVDIFFHAENTNWYSPLIRLECARNNADSAFTLAERMNLRDLVDFFSRVGITTRNAVVNQAVESVQWRYDAVRLHQRDVQDELDRPERKTNDRLNALLHRPTEQLDGLSQSLESLRRSNSSIARLLSLEPPTVQSIRDALPARSILVEFAPTADALFAIMFGPDSVRIRKTNASAQYISSVIRDYLQLMGELRLTTFGLRMSEPAALQRINELSSVLHNILIKPILAEIQGAEKLYVVLPEEFSWLPVHTLRGEGVALGARINVSYLPTAAALLFQQGQEHWARKIIGLGHPGTTTWDVEYELKDIRSFFEGVDLLFDTAATLTHLVDSTVDILHIAAEFDLDRAVPQNSHAVLADETHPVGLRNVPLGEMMKLPAPRTLVFSNISSTPGGLSRYAPLAFLANGTQEVIVSMWQGDRRAKKAFGEGLYTNLFAAAPVSEAYFRSIVGMTKRDEMSHVQRWGLYYQFGK